MSGRNEEREMPSAAAAHVRSVEPFDEEPSVTVQVHHAASQPLRPSLSSHALSPENHPPTNLTRVGSFIHEHHMHDDMESPGLMRTVSFNDADGLHQVQTHLTEVELRAAVEAARRDAELMDASPDEVREMLAMTMRSLEVPGAEGQQSLHGTPRGAENPALSMSFGGLANRVGLLSDAELLHIADLANKRASNGFSMLQYEGGAWYLPSISKCLPHEPEWGTEVSFKKGLVLYISGTRLQIHVLSFLLRAAMLAMLWFWWWLMVPKKLMQRGGQIFDPVCTFFVSAIVGGVIARILKVPPLICVFWVAIMWGNIPDGKPSYLTSGITSTVRSIVSKFGVTCILVRAGMALNVATLKSVWKNVLFLITIPLGLEIVVHGLIANKLFDYNGHYTWAFLQAALVGPTVPAIIVPSILWLRSEGYGNTRGPCLLMLPAAPIDMTLGIWATNFMVSLVYLEPDTNLGLQIASGPLQIIIGTIGGIILGTLWYGIYNLLIREAEKLPHGKYSRAHMRRVARTGLVLLLMMASTCVFFGYKYDVAGGGCMCTFFLAATVNAWMYQAKEPAMDIKIKMSRLMADFWDILVMPALFSMMGSSVDFIALFQGEFFWKAMVCILSGVIVRMIFTYIGTYGFPLETKERVLMCFIMAAKATAQIALGPLATQKLPANAFPAQKQWAANVNNVAVLSVIFFAPVAAVSATRIGPMIMKKDADYEAEAAAKAAIAATAPPVDAHTAAMMALADANNHHDEKQAAEQYQTEVFEEEMQQPVSVIATGTK